MSNEINFTDEDQAWIDRENAKMMLWDSVTEGELKKEVEAFCNQVRLVATYIETVVDFGDYFETRDRIQALLTSQLSPSGWLYAYCKENSEELGKYFKGNSKPDYYHNLSADLKKNFDVNVKYVGELSLLTPMFDSISRMLMTMDLKRGFLIQRITMNFYEAGFDEDLYYRINSDIHEVNELLNVSWDYLERHAVYARKAYDENLGIKSAEERNRLYREAMTKDYIFQVDALSHAHKSFIASSNGRFTVNPEIMAKVKILDKYTEQAALIENMVDNMNRTIDECNRIRRRFNDVQAEIDTKSCYPIIDALRDLLRKVDSFCDLSATVFNRYKAREVEAPFIFAKQIPAMSELNGKYGLNPISSDPFLDGTRFADLYLDAAYALTNHCRDFVKNHGHTEM